MTTQASDRYVSMDAVRGFAVLGILLMNIVGMGLPAFAYIDPTFYGGADGANLWTWAANFVFTDGKMRALFTMLFGASILLISDRAERGSGLGPAQTHYRRAFWLLLIGLIHGTVLWFGDILVFYAVAGMFAFPLRKLNPRLLIGIGAAVFFGLMAWQLYEHAHLVALQVAAEAPGAAQATIDAFREASFALGPPPGFVEDSLAGFGANVMQVTAARSQMFMLMHLAISTTEYVEAFGLILVGMGLFRLGFFTLAWPSRAYAVAIACGYLVCAPITAWMAWRIVASGFDTLTIHEMNIWTAAPRIPIALAHASVVMLLVRAGALTWLTDRLAAAGQMALSNYLLTSIIAVLVFDGWTLGLFGELQRYQLYFVVLGVWVAILLWSKPWMAAFHYGPFEWVWRSLVQWKRQPFAKSGPKLQPAE